MTGSLVHGKLTPIVGVGHCVDEADVVVVDGGKHLVAVRDHFRSWHGSKLFRRSVDRYTRQRSTLGFPGLESAIE